jgi:hypothetical protein
MVRERRPTRPRKTHHGREYLGVNRMTSRNVSDEVCLYLRVRANILDERFRVGGGITEALFFAAQYKFLQLRSVRDDSFLVCCINNSFTISI